MKWCLCTQEQIMAGTTDIDQQDCYYYKDEQHKHYRCCQDNDNQCDGYHPDEIQHNCYRYIEEQRQCYNLYYNENEQHDFYNDTDEQYECYYYNDELLQEGWDHMLIRLV